MLAMISDKVPMRPVAQAVVCLFLVVPLALGRGDDAPATALETPPAWQAIAAHPDYPSDDVIVAALQVTDRRLKHPLPAEPATEDCTGTFQEAIDQVYAAGGGTVFVPAGEYLFRGQLILRRRVTLRGRWQQPSSTGWKPGTVLKVAPENPKRDGPAFLTMDDTTVLQELAFWYPEQRPDAVRPYPFTVCSSGGNTLLNITFVNAYRALDASNAALAVFRGIYGTALETGMVAGNGVAFPRFEVIHFSPDYWTWWPLDEAQADPGRPGNYAYAMLNGGVGFRLREMDGFAWFHGDISGYSVGLVTEDQAGEARSEPDAPHGDGWHVTIHGCRTAMRLRRGGTTWHGCRFEGSTYGIQSSEHGGATFEDSRISGGEAAVHFAKGSGASIGMRHCRVKGPVVTMGRNRLELRDCDFTKTPSPLLKCSAAVDGTVQGCRSDGNPIAQPLPRNIDVAPNRSKWVPRPHIGTDYRTDWNRVRRPAKPDLFDVTHVAFAGGAKGDGKHDDTPAIRATVAAARRNGGGIVFLPTGYYRITGPIDLGRGVELRGASGGRYNAGAGQVQATRDLMTVLVVEAAGPADGIPLLTLADGSGVRNLLIFHPHQNWKRIIEGEPFRVAPYTIHAHGRGNYIISCCAPNPYQFADFDGAEDFLVEFCLTGGVRSVYRVRGGSRGGRIQTGHVKPSGFMGGLTDVPNTAANRMAYRQHTDAILQVFELQDCSDITLAGIFARRAHRFLTVNNASGHAILVGGEASQNGFVFERASREPFRFVGCGINAGSHGDGSGKHAILLEETFTGTADFFDGHFAGTSDYLFRVRSGTLNVHGGGTPNYGYRASRGVDVSGNGTLNLRGFDMSREWTLAVAPTAMASLQACKFRGGIPVGVSSDRLDLADNHSRGQIILCVPGQYQFTEQGLVLDRRHTERIEEYRSWAQQLNQGDAFRLNVTAPEFTDGRAGDVGIGIILYSYAPGKVAITYDGQSGPQRARFAGRHGREQTGLELKPRGFNFINATATNTRFGGDEDDIRIEFVEGDVAEIKPALSVVSVLKRGP